MMRAQSDRTWPRVVTASGVLHLVAVALAAFASPRGAVFNDAPEVVQPVEIDLDAPTPETPPETPHETPPETPPEAPHETPAARSARVAPSRTRAAAPANAATETPAPSTTQPAAPQGPMFPSRAPPAPSVRAADILRASNDATLRGASEAWIVAPPAASTRGSRDIFGGARGPCTSPECLRDLAMAPVREGLAGTRRDDRPAGSGRADPAVARRAIEELDLVRSVRGIGRAVASAPMHTVPGQRRSVTAGEGGVAEEFDQRHGASFSGMTLGASTSDLRYHLLQVEIEVEQSAEGELRSLRVSRPSGFQPLDAAASSALREALGASTWRAPGARWSRWRLEVSDAATSTPFVNNDGWTVYGEPSEGTRVRVRMRVVAQRLIAIAGAGG